MEKFWISRYALTQGVYCVECEHSPELNLAVDRSGRHSQFYHGEGRDFHKTKEAAAAKAEVMRAKKIASIRKQIGRLENLKF